MGPKRALVPLCGLLVVAVLCANSRSWGDATATMAVNSAVDSPVASVLERVRRTGAYNHPAYPWVVRARWVRGDTLYFVEFLHRREDGKGFDRVGKALQVTLSFSEEYRPFTFPWEESAPVRRDTLRVRVCQMEMEDEEGPCLFVDERDFDLTLPAGLRESSFRPYAEAEAHLSRRQRQALAKEWDLSVEQQTLLAAFGDKGCDLLRADIYTSTTGQTILAHHRAGTRTSGRLTTFETLAVARFDSAGKVLLRFRGTTITAETAEIGHLYSGDDSHSLTLKGPDGVKFILPGTKAAR